MSTAPPGQRIHVIIPALDEESSLPAVLDALAPLGNFNVVVVDNGSRDRTATVAAALGVKVVSEPRRGYGAACLAGLAALADQPGGDIVAFLDADGSDDPRELPKLLEPIARGQADFVLASRTLVAGEEGALTPVQHLGNRLACFLIARLWGVRYTDLAPCRALTLDGLRSLNMQDTDFGWTVEMQIRAARHGLRVQEIPSRYRRRRMGRSKISGSLLGSVRAGVTILGVILRERLTAGR
jgi:glycosyltransferase involved in cell wall biosynthesis